MKYIVLSIAILGILILGYFLFVFQSPINLISKKVAGIDSNLPAPDIALLTKPPIKIGNPQNPAIYSKTALLIDGDSNYILFEKESDLKVPIASTTKLMTALVVLEDYPDKLNEVVTITYPMIAVEGSDIKLQVGEKITVENLLKGLLIMSGNDTAYALAIHFGGKEAFVNKMNDKAYQLGLKDTHYADPSGLDDTGYSTAKELAIIAKYNMKYPIFREIVKIDQTIISSSDGTIVHELKTSNRLIKSDEFLYYPYSIGIKTGFTYAAGHCLVSAAQKDNHMLIGVVLNTNENTITASAKESRKLLDWGLNNWQWQE